MVFPRPAGPTVVRGLLAALAGMVTTALAIVIVAAAGPAPVPPQPPPPGSSSGAPAGTAAQNPGPPFAGSRPSRRHRPPATLDTTTTVCAPQITGDGEAPREPPTPDGIGEPGRSVVPAPAPDQPGSCRPRTTDEDGT